MTDVSWINDLEVKSTEAIQIISASDFQDLDGSFALTAALALALECFKENQNNAKMSFYGIGEGDLTSVVYYMKSQ